MSLVEVDDGEAGEATLLSVRAKMYYHDKDAGWKERGGGMLKINVPQGCIEYDETGAPILGTFDASALESSDGDDDKAQGHKVPRLLMRQDQTLRVILNTALLPAMTFQEKASLKTVSIFFTAIEGEPAKPVNVTMKVSLGREGIILPTTFHLIFEFPANMLLLNRCPQLMPRAF